MRIVKDGWIFIALPIVVFGALGGVVRYPGWPVVGWTLWIAGLLMAMFMVYFFRDPERTPPEDTHAIVAGADGVVRAVETIRENKDLNTDAIRVSIFLNPFDVHVNRAPIGGTVTGLSYTPGRHLLTISNASSEHNEHSSIRIEGEKTRCLVRQIVGPVVRRVVYWLTENQVLGKGERIGMMKFGSRLDMYFPAADVNVTIRKGERVRAGETVIATITKE